MEWMLKIVGGLAGFVVLLFAGYLLYYFAIPYWNAPDSLDKKTALKIIEDEAQIYRAKSYSQLLPLINKSEYKEIKDSSGKEYYIQISGFWDGGPDADIRVRVSISDGGKSAYIPLITDFIMSPSGKFIGE